MKTFILILVLTLTTNSALMDKFRTRLNNIRKSLFPTENELLKIDELDDIKNPFLKETSKNMIDKKEDGIYLLYNLIYYNFLLNLNKFCLLRYSLKNCNDFHIYANNILTVEIKKEKKEIIDKDINNEETEQTIERIKEIEEKDYFNIASVYEIIFKTTGDENFDKFLGNFKEEFEKPDDNFNNDAASLMEMYQENLESLSAYLNTEQEDEQEQIKIILAMEKQKNFKRV